MPKRRSSGSKKQLNLLKNIQGWLASSVTIAVVLAALAITLHTEMGCEYNPFDLKETCKPSNSKEDQELYSNLSKWMFWLSIVVMIPAIVALFGSLKM